VVEKRLEGLEEVQQRLDAAILALQEAEKQRVAEEEKLAELKVVLEQSRRDVELITTQAEAEAERAELAASRVDQAEADVLRITEQVDTAERRLIEVADLVAKGEMDFNGTRTRCEELKAEEAALLERLPKLTAEVEGIETRLREMEAAQKAQEEASERVAGELKQKEERLRQIETELAMLSEAKERAEAVSVDIERLTLRRDELEAAVALAIGQEDEAKVRGGEARAEKEALDEELKVLRESVTALRLEEEQLQGLKEEMDRLIEAKKRAEEEVQGLDVLTARREEMEKGLAEAARAVEEARERGEAARVEKEKLDLELSGLREVVEGMRLEERKLAGQVDAQRNDLHAAGVAVERLRQKMAEMESQVSEFTRSGGELISVGEALMAMKARKEETQKSIKEAGETELELQVRLGALQEAVNRESARVEQAGRNRAEIEEEFRVFAEKMQEEAQKMREQRAALAKEVEQLKGQKAAFAEAEEQMKQWGQVEARLRGQLEELEEKHEVMRAGLKVEEATVLMFAGDLIKRLDLIDSLRQRYAGADVAEQLYTLRASIEDVLLQHGVVEFDVEPGTAIDVELRRRIAVVDTVPGTDRARVVETFRSGFLRVMDDGQERILRKLEVRSSTPG
jgi:chromosome segregation ATPase